MASLDASGRGRTNSQHVGPTQPAPSLTGRGGLEVGARGHGRVGPEEVAPGHGSGVPLLPAHAAALLSLVASPLKRRSPSPVGHRALLLGAWHHTQPSPRSWYSCPMAQSGFEGSNLMTQSHRDCGGPGSEQPLHREAAHSLWPFPPKRVGLWGSCFWNVCLSMDTVRTRTQVGFCFS